MGGNKNAIAKRNFVLYQEQLKDGKQHNLLQSCLKFKLKLSKKNHRRAMNPTQHKKYFPWIYTFL